MHKCPDCGQEFEGNFCPNCGAEWQEEKTCPECGAKLSGSSRFCNRCGHSFTGKTEPRPSNFKQKLSKIGGWIKSHVKIVVPVALGLVIVIILLSLIPTFIAMKTNGTYYGYRNGNFDEDDYFTLSGGKWTDNDGETGTYKIDGENIIFFVEFFGSNEELATGTISNGVIALDVGGGVKETYVKKDHKHQFGEWKTTVEATCSYTGTRIRTCACGLIETEKTDTIPHAPDEAFLFDDENHWKICSVCGDEAYLSAHDDENGCSVCGYPFFNYTLSSDGTSYSVSGVLDENSTSANIPATFKGLPVTSIGNKAFDGCTALTSISIPDSVTSIGEYAFANCTSLESVTIPDGVTSISIYAFRNCSSLTSITISDSVTSIGNGAFNGCAIETANIPAHACGYVKSNKLKTVIVTSGETINEFAFDGCTSLENVTIGNSVTSIESEAFYGCTSLKNVTIPNSVTEIGNRAFANCTALTSVTIGNRVKSIGEYAFDGCTALTSVTIGNSVTSIGNGAFLYCTALTSISVPDSVTSIDIQAFYGCSSLESITIGNSVTSIGNFAFGDCTSLESITIPDSVTSSIGSQMFVGCSSLKNVTIGNSVTSINQYAFQNFTSLISVTIGNSVKSIGEYAFKDCTSLTSVTIGNSVTSIGNGAFRNCTSLTSISIPDSVTSIGESAFYGCSSLESVTIPDSVTTIYEYAFSYCTALTSFTFQGTTAKWQTISKRAYWASNTGNYTIYCTDGEIAKNGTVTTY